MEDKELIKSFLRDQSVLALATIGQDEFPWICNVYFAYYPEDLSLYFVSSTETKHGKNIENNRQIAFNISWFNQDDFGDRKGIQGTGSCIKIFNPKDLDIAANYYKKKFGSDLDIHDLLHSESKHFMYKITPKYIKYWDDEHFPDNKTTTITI
jgi:uncharacterized protein YhbP (UPF0306 family)